MVAVTNVVASLRRAVALVSLQHTYESALTRESINLRSSPPKLNTKRARSPVTSLHFPGTDLRQALLDSTSNPNVKAPLRPPVPSLLKLESPLSPPKHHQNVASPPRPAPGAATDPLKHPPITSRAPIPIDRDRSLQAPQARRQARRSRRQCFQPRESCCEGTCCCYKWFVTPFSQVTSSMSER